MVYGAGVRWPLTGFQSLEPKFFGSGVPQLDVSRLEGVVRELVSYHDVLRISFSRAAEVWTQQYPVIDSTTPELSVWMFSRISEQELEGDADGVAKWL